MTPRRPDRAAARSSRPSAERAVGRSAPAFWPRRLTLRLLASLPPAILVWVVLQPLYNRLWARLQEPVIRLFEVPDRTTLYLKGYDVLMITRSDYGGGQGFLGEIRVADLHFPWILFAALVWATPDTPPRERWRALAVGSLVFLGFHLLLGALRIEFVYATQMGDWSLAHYGPQARTAIGLLKHLFDLPVKLALPFAVWLALLGQWLPWRTAAGAGASAAGMNHGQR